MSHSLFRRRPVAALLFVLQVAGCTTWHVETIPPAEVIAHRHPDQLRVEGMDGKRMMFYGPQVEGDSLRGREWPASTGSRAVPLDGVRSVSTSRFNAGRTIGLVLGIPAAAVLGLFIALRGRMRQRGVQVSSHAWPLRERYPADEASPPCAGSYHPHLGDQRRRKPPATLSTP